MSATSREIIDRIRLRMPVVVTLPDPITGEPFTVNRDNLLALLVIDVNNLAFESQTVAALYGEMSRIRAAAWRSHQETEVRFREWKAGKRAQCRKAAEKKATKEEQEDFYRSAPDYKENYQETINLAVLVSLFDDLKKAFEIKSRALYNLSGETFGHNKVQNASERMSEVELENLAIATTEKSGSAGAAADFREQGLPGTPPPPPEEETEEEAAEEETEEAPEETPPTSSRRRATKKKKVAKKKKTVSKKKSTKRARSLK